MSAAKPVQLTAWLNVASSGCVFALDPIHITAEQSCVGSRVKTLVARVYVCGGFMTRVCWLVWVHCARKGTVFSKQIQQQIALNH